MCGELCWCSMEFAYYSYCRNHTGQEFVVPAQTMIVVKLLKIIIIFLSNHIISTWYGASLGGTLCNTSKIYVQLVRLTSHESKTTQKAQRPNKHHHHIDGAANPSSGRVDLMNSCRWRGGWPSAIFFQCRYQRIYIDSLNLSSY